MAESKDGYAKISIRRDTHAKLKELAEKNNVTLSSMIDDVVSHIEPGSVQSTDVRLDKIDDTLSLILINLRKLNNRVLDMDDELAHSDALPKYSSGVRRREYERRKDAHEQEVLESKPEYQAWIKAAREGTSHSPAFDTKAMKPVPLSSIVYTHSPLMITSPDTVELGDVPSLESLPERTNFKPSEKDKKGIIFPRPNPKNLKR